MVKSINNSCRETGMSALFSFSVEYILLSVWNNFIRQMKNIFNLQVWAAAYCAGDAKSVIPQKLSGRIL